MLTIIYKESLDIQKEFIANTCMNEEALYYLIWKNQKYFLRTIDFKKSIKKDLNFVMNEDEMIDID